MTGATHPESEPCSRQESNLLPAGSEPAVPSVALRERDVPAAGIEPAVPKPQFYGLLPCRLGSRWPGVTGGTRTLSNRLHGPAPRPLWIRPP